MRNGPYFYGNMPIISWNSDVDFELDADLISRIPIWVKFPRLSIGYSFVIALILASNAIGIPLVQMDLILKLREYLMRGGYIQSHARNYCC